MELDNNLMNLCFELTDMYELYFRNKLRENSIAEDDIDNIVKDFDFRKEIILSLNKEYKRGKAFDTFCLENAISDKLPAMLKFYGSLYNHQEEAIKSILKGICTVISTGTGICCGTMSYGSPCSKTVGVIWIAVRGQSV